MIDIKLIRDDVENVIEKLSTRQKDFSYLRDVKAMDEKRRLLLVEVEKIKSIRNEKSKLIGQLKREKKDVQEVMDSVAHLGQEIVEKDNEIAALEEKIEYALLTTPNLLHQYVPIGKD